MSLHWSDYGKIDPFAITPNLCILKQPLSRLLVSSQKAVQLHVLILLVGFYEIIHCLLHGTLAEIGRMLNRHFGTHIFFKIVFRRPLPRQKAKLG